MSSHGIYLIVGEPFLSGEALDKIREAEGTDPLSETSFHADTELPELMGALDTPSLLGGRRLVIVRDAQSLKKDHIEALERYIASPSPHAVLVLISAGRSKLEAAVKKSGAVVSLDMPKGRRLVTWLRERSAAHGVKIDDRGAWALIDALGTSLRDLDGALEQLGTQLGQGAKIGAAEVRQAFSRLADERVYALTDAVGDRKLPIAMTALRRLLEQGDEPLVIFGAINNHMRRMLRARRYSDGGPRAVGDALGLPAWRAERLHKQARAYREEELISAVELLAETDVELKGGDMPGPAALERMVLQIITGSKPARMF
jgi:DNA polymerase-3 subunit delta